MGLVIRSTEEILCSNFQISFEQLIALVAVSQKLLEVTRKVKYETKLWSTDFKIVKEGSCCFLDPDSKGMSACC